MKAIALAVPAALLVAGALGAPQRVELRRGERAFRIGGKPGFVLGRNPTEKSVEAFDARFAEAARGGDRLVRLHLMHGIPPGARPGEIDPAWAARWDRVFDAAERNGLAVIPVFTIWAQWNDGGGGEEWHVWNDNPYNAARGGPARSPADLLGDTETRRLWLRWLGALVKRWQSRRCIVAWEPISELDLVTGSTPPAAASFTVAASRVIRSQDRRRRPVTVSLSSIRDWPEVFGSPSVDIVQAHPYANEPPWAGRLADLVLDVAHRRLERYGKPVLLGECGLDWRAPAGTLAEAARAPVGIRQALWAAAVSGSLAGRMLWWEDGYGTVEGRPVEQRHRDASLPVARFVEGVSYAGLAPVAVETSPGIKGGALASTRLVLGWFRDAECDPPEWPVRRVTGQAVTIPVSGKAHEWRVELVDTRSGSLLGSFEVEAPHGRMVIALPPFEESIAFRARAR